MKLMLIMSGDRISAGALDEIEVSENLILVLDKTTNIKRVLRLILRRKLKLILVLKMMLCELFRTKTRNFAPQSLIVRSNKDLLLLINSYSPDKVILFRAGLVISKEVIACGIPLLNIHCAKVPEYGGLGSIDRALRARAVNQSATLHQVTTTIDEGEVFDIEPYKLDLSRGYCFNENLAYEAGLRLLKRTISVSSHKKCRA